MRVRRTIPPSAAPVGARELLRGIREMFRGACGEEAEAKLAASLGAGHVFLVSSGKAALHLILAALYSLRGKRTVIVPAYTCYSVPAAVVRSGLEIRLCDIAPQTLDYDYEMLEKIVDASVLGILSTDLFGVPADTPALKERYGKYGIFVIEDAAQAMGGTCGERRLGSRGDVGFFSLGRGKNLSAGRGGIIVTSADPVADAIRGGWRMLGREPFGEEVKQLLATALLTIFLRPTLYWLPSQLPFLGIGETRYDEGFPVHRLGEFNAGLLAGWESRLERFGDARARTSGFYLRAIGSAARLPIHAEVLPFLRFPFYVSDPEQKRRLCREYGHLGVSPMYPDTIDRIPALSPQFRGQTFPGARYVADHLVTFPTHVLLNDRDKAALAEILESARGGVR